MRKKYLLVFSFFYYASFSQNVGINPAGTTPNSSAILDLNTGNTFGSGTSKGLLVPNVALTSITDAVTVTSPATSLLVYNTATAGASPNNVVPGYYYWNGVKWVAFGGTGGKDWSLTGNAGTTAGTNFLGTTDAVDMVFKTNNTEWMRILSTGNVGIGTPVPGAKLSFEDLTATTADGITWYNPAPLSYGIYKTAGSWTGPNYQQLNQSWQTGIVIDGGSLYGLSGTIMQPSGGNVAVGQNVKGAYNLEVNGSFGFGDGTAGSYRSRTETRPDAGLWGSTAQSGFYQTSAPAPSADWHMAPAGIATTALDANGNAQNWWHLIDCRHSNNANNYALQIAGSFFDQNLYYRKTNSNGAQSWTQIATSAWYGNNIQNVKLTTCQVTSSAGFVAIPGMSITFTPVHNTVYIYVSCSGRYTDNTGSFTANGSSFGYLRVYNVTSSTQVAITQGMLSAYDGTASTVSAGYMGMIGIPVAVTAGTSVTLRIDWFLGRINGAGYFGVCPTAGAGDHLSFTIED